jgi:seryl-tRNA synthetase
VSTRSVETARAVRKADPALAEEVKQGKTKLAAAAKIVAKKVPAGTKERDGVEVKRHDDRMKSARSKREAFVRDYSDMAEWNEVIEAIKTQVGAKHV